MIKELNQQMAGQMYWKLINELRLKLVESESAPYSWNSDLIDQVDSALERAGVMNKLMQLNDAPIGIFIVNRELRLKVEKTSRD